MENLPHEPQTNPITTRAFKRQVGLEIYLPLGIVLLLLGALVYVLWSLKVAGFSHWADIALVFLLIPLFLIGLFLLGICASIMYGISVAIGWLPYPARQGQDLFVRVRVAVSKGADVVMKPILIPGAVVAAIQRGFTYLVGIFRSPKG